MAEPKKDQSHKYFKPGHALYPAGRVIVTDENGTTEYTLDEWHALQSSQPQE